MAKKHDKFPILFLGTQMEVAGAQRSLLAQARWFHLQGYPVQAVFFYDKQGLQESWQAANPFPVISLNGWGGRSVFSKIPNFVRALVSLYKMLRKDIKAIVAFTPHSNLLSLPLAWLARVPVRVGTHHGYIEGSSKPMAWLHGRLTNSRICSVMVAVSAQVREYALRREGAKDSRVVVIQNGIEAPARTAGKSRVAAREELGIPKGGLLLLTVGRLTVQKGHTVLLDAIAQISARAPQTYFAFAGDGPRRAPLEAQAARLGITERVRFLGVRSDVAALLFASDVFVQPSLWEGLSLALLEALFAGLPVVATRVEGVVDVVEDGVSALLVPPNDASALAVALARVFEDATLRARLAAAGQTRSEANYGIDQMCKAYESLLQGLLNGV